MGAYDNPTVAPMVNVGKIIGDNIQRIQQADYLAKEQKKNDKLLLESGAIDRTNAFENQSLDLRKKETSIDNMNEVASMMVDKYYENEKNYAGKRIDANEYRRIRQNLWNNLNQYQAFQKNTATTIVNYKKDSEDDLISQSFTGLQKQKRLESFKKRKATIVAGDDGKARIKISYPEVENGQTVEKVFEKPLEEFVNNPDLLSYDKKADLKTMTKTMAELAKANLHESSSYKTVKADNMFRYFYDEDQAKKILMEDDDLNGFVSANLESIVEDYMPGDNIFVNDTPENHDCYVEQLNKAKDWYAGHIYDQGLGREVGRKAVPQTRASKLPPIKKVSVRTDKSPNADRIRNLTWDNREKINVIDASLIFKGRTVFGRSGPILKMDDGEDFENFKERLNEALDYVTPAKKPSPKK